ncbi:MAG: pirin family protein [Candidatus Cryosericum sp.]
MSYRNIHTIFKGHTVMEGAGVRLQRIFGFGDTELTDPFLLLDHFGSSDPADYVAGFPWHPHRGIETVTYMLDGVVEHADSMGNHGAIGAGQVQWMTAGSGIIHQEMPQETPGTMRGYQLWVNLPAASKMTVPRYRDIHAEDIPVVQRDGTDVRVICGAFGGVSGPARDIIAQPWYFDVRIPPGRSVDLNVRVDDTVLCFMVEGHGWMDHDKTRLIASDELAVMTGGNAVLCTAEDDGMRFLLMAGKPLHEPVAWRGPIVMNTNDELHTAFAELRAGTFIKH